MSSANACSLVAGTLYGAPAAGCSDGGVSIAASPAESASVEAWRIAGGSSFEAASPAVLGISAPMNTDLRSIVDAALVDALRRTGRERLALKVVSSEAVIWPDANLGCPNPGGELHEGVRTRLSHPR